MSSIKSKIIQIGKTHSQIVFLALIIIVLSTVVTFVNPRFMSALNISNLFRQISVTGICAIAMALVLISGGFDLSIGSLVSLISCVIASLVNSGMPEAGALLCGMLCGLVCGGINGIIIAKSRCAPVIITLGTMGVFKGAALLIAGGNIINFNEPIPILSTTVIFGRPTIVIILAFVVIVTYLFLKLTIMGRRIYALGSNQEASFLSGVNIVLTKMIVYAIAGLIVSFASIALLMRLGSASAVMGDTYTLSAVASAVIGGIAISGGRGSIGGCFLGILLLGLISNSMNIMGVTAYLQDIVLGMIVVIAAVVSVLGTRGSKA